MMTSTKILFVSGWGYGSLQTEWQEVTTHTPVETYRADEWLALTFEEQKAKLNTKTSLILVGWSLGAWCLGRSLAACMQQQQMDNILGAVWLSAARTFTYTQNNPYGVPLRVIRRMKHGLESPLRRQTVLKYFYKQAAFPAKDSVPQEALLPSSMIATSLITGLHFLENATLDPIRTHRPKHTIIKQCVFHGREDAILSWKGGERLAADLGARWELFADVGHCLVHHKKNAIYKILQDHFL